jgi:hypothetical protein
VLFTKPANTKEPAVAFETMVIHRPVDIILRDHLLKDGLSQPRKRAILLRQRKVTKSCEEISSGIFPLFEPPCFSGRPIKTWLL